MTIAASAGPAPVTRADVAELKRLFPPEVVDSALNDGNLVLIDEQKVNDNGNNPKI